MAASRENTAVCLTMEIRIMFSQPQSRRLSARRDLLTSAKAWGLAEKEHAQHLGKRLIACCKGIDQFTLCAACRAVGLYVPDAIGAMLHC
jgi:glycerol-3-phosphate dehydrogenase (NAD(P)+)